MTDAFWGNYSNALGALGQVGGQITSRRAGSRLAQGDYRGAANTLFESGDLQRGMALQQHSQAQDAATRQRQTEGGLRVVRALREAEAAGQDIGAAFDSFAPFLSQLGLTQEDAGPIRNLVTSQGGLDQIERILGQQAPEWEFRDGGAGDVVAVRARNGRIESQLAYNAPERPISTPYGILLPPSAAGALSGGMPSAAPSVSPPSSGSGGPADAVSVIQELIPGVTFNSGLRTPDQNRAARGSDRSYHLSGMAVDIPPQRGRDIEEFRRELEARGVNVRELIDEGNHWHIAWEGGEPAPNFGRGEAPRSGPVRSATSAPQQGGDIQDIGGGWGLQSLQTNADRRAERAEIRADRADARAERAAARADATVQPLSAQEVAALGLPEGTVAQRAPNGQISVVARGGERFTEGQTQAAAFAYRAQNATRTLNRLESAGFARPTAAILAFGEGRIRENALNAQDRQWLQAAREWLAPILRKDTGAAVAPGELVTYMGIYLPSPTDDAQTIAQKRQARAVAERGLVGQSRGAFEALFGQEQQSRPRTNAPGLPFNINETQLAYRNRLAQSGASSSAPLGSARNPYYTNPQDERSGLSNYQRRANESGRDVVVITSRGPAILRPARGGR